MNKKHLTKLFSILLSIIVVFSLGFDYKASANDEDIEIVKVGYVPESNLVDNINSYQSKGYGYEILKKIEDVTNLEFQFVEVDGDPRQAVLSGVVDIAGLYFKTDEREETFLYSATQYGSNHVSLVTKDESVYYDDPASFDGKTVVTYDGNVANEALLEYCEENDITMNFIYGDIDNFAKEDGDFYLVDSEDYKFLIEGYKSVLNVGTYNLYLISRYNNQDIMDKINEGLLEVVNTEGNFFLELEEKYFAQNIELNHRGLTKEEAEFLKGKILKVAYISHYQPITYTNENNQADGSMVDTLNHLAEIYEFEIEYYPYSIYDEEIPEDVDIVATIYGKDEYYLKDFTPTESYLDLPMSCAVSPQVLSFSETDYEIITSSPRIGILEYLSLDYDAFLDVFQDNEIIYYNSMYDLIDDLSNDELDIGIFSQSASSQVELLLDDDSKSIIPIDLVVPMQYLVSNDSSEELLPILNVILDLESVDFYSNVLSANANEFTHSVSEDKIIQDFLPYAVIITFVVIAIYLISYITEQRKKREIILNAYNTEPLTGLLSTAKFNEKIQELLEDAKPYEFEIISFDIDLFKSINSYYSSDKGTQVIKAIGEALKDAYNGSTALLMRKTSDQFIIFKETRDKRNIKEIYNTYICPEIKNIIGEKFNLSLSFGLYIIDNTKISVTDMIAFADTARVLGKNKHETTFIVFDDSMKKKYENKINITFRMEQALKDKEFYVVYQPKVDFKTLQVAGAEALIRWKPRFGDPIYPDTFIPVFEKNGFISSLDKFVLEEVCKFIVENKRKLKLPVISVNISAVTILEDGLISDLANILSRYEMKANNIELEITETAIIGNENKFLIKIKQLKKMGFIIAIDDFGAGVSSLNRLSAIEADILKLDKTFFDLKGQGAKSTVVVESVIKMAKNLNMKIVTEGVETFGQAIWLRDLDCDMAQGYYFEKPILENQFVELLENNKIYHIK